MQVIQSWYFLDVMSLLLQQVFYWMIVCPLKSLDLHSGSDINSIHTGIIDLYTNLAPANNSANNKLYFCPV